MKIALDIGTRTGYAVFDKFKLVECKTITLPTAGTKSEPSVLGRRFRIIKELLSGWELTHVYYERTDWFRSANPKEGFQARLVREKQNRVVQRALGRIEGLIESAAVDLKLIAIPVGVHEAKKALTGNGNASKEIVAKAIKDVFPQLVSEASQDSLDAASIMAYAMSNENALWRFEVAKLVEEFKKDDF